MLILTFTCLLSFIKTSTISRLAILKEEISGLKKKNLKLYGILIFFF